MCVLGNFPNLPFLIKSGLNAIANTATSNIAIGNNMPTKTLFIFRSAKVRIFAVSYIYFTQLLT